MAASGHSKLSLAVGLSFVGFVLWLALHAGPPEEPLTPGVKLSAAPSSGRAEPIPSRLTGPANKPSNESGIEEWK